MTNSLTGVYGAGGGSNRWVEVLGHSAGRFERGRPFVLLDGHVEGLQRLAGELGLAATDADEEILAVGYRRWGEELVSRIRGQYALLAWDPDTEVGFIAVDQLGAGSIFFHEAPGRLTFASEIADLIDLLPRRPAPDRVSVIRHLSAGFLEHGRTLYEGLSRLEGGHLLRLRGGGWEKRRYWAMRYVEPQRMSRTEAVEELRRQLGAAIERRMAPDGVTGVLLSGGLDSSSVAAVATSVDNGSPARLRGYSVVFPDHAEVDEGPRIESVTRQLALPSFQHRVEGGSLLPASVEFLQKFQLPAHAPNLFFTLPLLRRGVEDGVAVFLDGQGGDELLGCSPYLLADRIRHARVLSAFSLARRLPTGGAGTPLSVRTLVRQFGVRGAAPHRLHHLRTRQFQRYAPAWMTDQSARLLAEARDPWLWKTNKGPRWWAYLSELVTRWRERSGAHDLMRREAALAGTSIAHPLLDDLDLIEFALQVPPELSFHPYFDRPLLREAMQGLLPDDVRLRQGKNFYHAFYVDYLSGRDQADLVRLLTAPDAEIRAYVRLDVVHDQLVRPLLERRGFAWAWPVWRLTAIECWLRFQASDATHSVIPNARAKSNACASRQSTTTQ